MLVSHLIAEAVELETELLRRADEISKLKASAPTHPFSVDLEEKSKAFDEAASKFSITA